MANNFFMKRVPRLAVWALANPLGVLSATAITNVNITWFAHVALLPLLMLF